MDADCLIVGAGFTGSVIAERLATRLGYRVIVVDRRSHIGGNAHDEIDVHGVRVHRYGAHIFHTNSERIWSYLSDFTAWHPYRHHVLAEVGDRLLQLPYNLNSLYASVAAVRARQIEAALLADYGPGETVPILKLLQSSNDLIRNFAQQVYDSVFLNYTRKQWGEPPDKLPAEITSRVPIRISRDDSYFLDRFQGIPRDGYSAIFQRLLDHPNIRVVLDTPYTARSSDIQTPRIVVTGPIDEYFGYRHGPLPYRSLHFEFQTFTGIARYQPVGVVNFPNAEAFTRVIEFKHMTYQRHPDTTIAVEYPQPHIPGENEPYYPVPNSENRRLYSVYTRDAQLVSDKTIFAGRLGTYRYLNMDQAVGQAISVFKRLAEADAARG